MDYRLKAFIIVCIIMLIVGVVVWLTKIVHEHKHPLHQSNRIATLIDQQGDYKQQENKDWSSVGMLQAENKGLRNEIENYKKIIEEYLNSNIITEYYKLENLVTLELLKKNNCNYINILEIIEWFKTEHSINIYNYGWGSQYGHWIGIETTEGSYVVNPTEDYKEALIKGINKALTLI